MCKKYCTFVPVIIMKRLLTFTFSLILLLLPSFQGRAGDRLTEYNLDDIILDIYNAATELGETDYEQLQTDLYALHDAPINLNTATDEELSQLYFLSPK